MLTLFYFIVTLGVLVIIHEFGHYAVARACGVKILRFSVGFGRPLLRATRGRDRTEWVVGAIPLGGYVRMLDERDPECGPVAAAERSRAFNRQSLARRTAIVLAGPVANLLLAVAIYAGLNLVGVAELRPVVDTPPQSTPAAIGGLRSGDLVTAIDGDAVRSWPDLRWRILRHSLQPGPLRFTVVGADGAERTLEVAAPADLLRDVDTDFLDRLGLHAHPGRSVVAGVDPDGVAAAAGILAGDRIESIDGTPVAYAREVAERVRSAPGRPLRFGLVRSDRHVELVVTPARATDPKLGTIGRIGVEFSDLVRVRYAPLESVELAVGKTWDTAAISVRMMGKMVIGEASWRNLSGPVTIADYAGRSARIGLDAYLGFLALVSISLGVLNLMPVPMLDGGHLLYYAAELLTGSPPSDRAVAIGQRIGIAVLTLLTVLALCNDVVRLLS
ncbi:MAG TPA: RIP metalloprotease RseP [Burkholderiaceae bacterium]|nr:RIP metalloprotease RseP [Burkholderiaceae bacterium]